MSIKDENNLVLIKYLTASQKAAEDNFQPKPVQKTKQVWLDWQSIYRDNYLVI